MEIGAARARARVRVNDAKGAAQFLAMPPLKRVTSRRDG